MNKSKEMLELLISKGANDINAKGIIYLNIDMQILFLIKII